MDFPDGTNARTAADALLRVMQADVRARLDDPNLSPRDLAARHHISLRYVYQIFGRVDATPADYIREQRLQAACAALASAPTIPISIIANRLGFSDGTAFVRVFRRRFATTPSDFRARALAGWDWSRDDPEPS